MQGDHIFYAFTLVYDPKPLSGSNVVRTNKATVIVECHYPRYVTQKTKWVDKWKKGLENKNDQP